MKKILILLAIILVSCNEKKRNTDINNQTKSEDTIVNVKPKNKEISNQSIQIYSFENDTILQRVKIIKITKKEISFVITSEDKREGNKKQIEGIALTSDNSDIEFEEDEEGNALPIAEYLYKRGECWLSVRIGIENQNFLKLKEARCNIFNKSYSLNTGFFLKKEQ